MNLQLFERTIGTIHQDIEGGQRQIGQRVQSEALGLANIYEQSSNHTQTVKSVILTATLQKGVDLVLGLLAIGAHLTQVGGGAVLERTTTIDNINKQPL